MKKRCRHILSFVKTKLLSFSMFYKLLLFFPSFLSFFFRNCLTDTHIQPVVAFLRFWFIWVWKKDDFYCLCVWAHNIVIGKTKIFLNITNSASLYSYYFFSRHEDFSNKSMKSNDFSFSTHEYSLQSNLIELLSTEEIQILIMNDIFF